MALPNLSIPRKTNKKQHVVTFIRVFVQLD